MRLDSEIERDVKEELQWDPDLDATDIAVSVKKGVVTLAGFVQSYTDKYEAEAAAKRVAGVVGVANDIEVRMPSVDERPDPGHRARRGRCAQGAAADLVGEHQGRRQERLGDARRHGRVAISEEYRRNGRAPDQRRQGRHQFDRCSSRASEPIEIKSKIEDAFKRNAEVDANRIQVEANGSEVILKGNVRSWIEREEAERVAWSAPGVTNVEDRIVVARKRRSPQAGASPCAVRSQSCDNASQHGACIMNLRSLVPFRDRASLARPEFGVFGSLHRESRSSVRRFRARRTGAWPRPDQRQSHAEHRHQRNRQGNRDHRRNAGARAQGRRDFARRRYPDHSRRKEDRATTRQGQREAARTTKTTRTIMSRTQLRRVLSRSAAAARASIRRASRRPCRTEFLKITIPKPAAAEPKKIEVKEAA